MNTIESILDTLTRDSIDSSAVEESLRYATVKNFHNLYNTQYEICGLRRFDIPFQDLTRITRLKSDISTKKYPKRYGYSIPISIITKDTQKKCKELGLYDIPLTQEDIAKYPDIFNYNFMIVVDGYFISTGDIIVTTSGTMITIDVNPGDNTNEYLQQGIPTDVFIDYYDKNAVLSLFLLPNYSISHTTFNKFVYNTTLAKKIPINRFSNKEMVNKDNTWIFANIDSDSSMLKRVDYTIEEKTPTDRYVVINPDVEFDIDNISVYAVSFDYLVEEITVSPDELNWIQLTGYDMPVPVENIICMTYDDNNGISIQNEITPKLYYPNIYEVQDIPENSTIRLGVFYKDSNDQKYINDFALLNILSGNLCERYANSELPELVMNYEPVKVDYFSSDDFLESEFYTNRVMYPAKTLYDIGRFSKIAEVDPDALLKYIYLKMKHLPRYYLDVSKLTLDNRIRKDTTNEQDNIIDTVYFDEDMYLFSFPKKFIGSIGFDFRIFIDNYYICPYNYSWYAGADFYHFYIPTRLIKPDSVIEFEKYKEYEYVSTGIVENGSLTISLPEKYRRYGVYAHDIFVVDSYTKDYIPYANYNIKTYNDVVEKEIIVEPHQYSRIHDDFTIKFASQDVDYNGKELIVHIYHRTSSNVVSIDETIKGDKTKFPYELMIPNYNNVNNTIVRAFANGICLPSEAYTVIPGDTYSVPTDIGLFIDDNFELDLNEIVVDVLPTSSRLEYYCKQIDNPYGFIDTGDCLSLPFDLKWYDIYVNGRKLHKFNVDIITTNKFFIKGINSLKNVYIFCRGDIYDEFHFSHSMSYDNFLFENVDEIYEELIKDRDIIEDTLTDITSGIIEDIRDWYSFINAILEYTFINPNLNQITQDIIDTYPMLINQYGMLPLYTNVDYLDDVDMITEINSNKRSATMKNHRHRYSFTPLHIGNHEDALNGEYMCDPITGAPGMKDDKGDIIPIGALDRLHVHENSFSESLAGNNIAYLNIYNLEPETTTGVRDVTVGDNLIEEPLVIESPVTKMVLSVDMDVLERGYQNIMNRSAYSPRVKVEYSVSVNDNVTTSSYVSQVSTLNNVVNNINSDNLTINSIILLPENDDDTMENVKCILHSVLISF